MERRFLILDALRGILAIIVVLGHLGLPPLLGSVDQSDATGRALARLLRTFAFGPPAVIAFFVISGFCIHIAFANPAAQLPVFRFYARRYLRIGLPVVGVVILMYFLKPNLVVFGAASILWKSTLWSVLCEEIYYAIYPMLRKIRRAIGMQWLLFGSSIVSLAIIVATFPAVEWNELGVLGTSAVLLPVWLLGAVLAEAVKSATMPSISLFTIRCWRLGAFLTMWLSLVLHFHSEFHQTASGLLVGIFAFLWLGAELAFAAKTPPSSILVWFGTWSYSLYLVHPVVIDVVARAGITSVQSVEAWLLCIVLVLVLSYLFYLVIEAPSHALARKVSLRMTTSHAAAPASVLP